jgi:hypothetical protein
MHEILRTVHSPRRRDNTSGYSGGVSKRTDGKKGSPPFRFCGQVKGGV